MNPATLIFEAERLGTYMQVLREEKRMTMEEVASTMGTSAAHLYRLERGLTSPTWLTLMKWARALEIDTMQIQFAVDTLEKEVIG